MNTLVDAGFSPRREGFAPQPLIEALLSILPAHCVLHREEDTRPYECDGLSLYRALPAVVALPEDEAQVRAIMQLCKRMNVPIVARGAGPVCRAGPCRTRRACCWGCPSSTVSSA